MSGMSFDISHDLDKLDSKLSQETLKRAALAGGEVIRGNAKVNINKTFSKSHGDAGLAGTIQVVVENSSPNGCEISVGPTAIHGRIRELGGTIKPINKKLLSWVDEAGERAFAKSVTVEPKPYLRPAVDEHVREIEAATGEQIRQGIERSK